VGPSTITDDSLAAPSLVDRAHHRAGAHALGDRSV